MTKTVSYHWHLRKVMNEHGLQSTTDLVPLLADCGEVWTRRATSANALAMRSRIVLTAADGLGNTAIAAKVGGKVGTARRWRIRFLD